MRKNSIKNTRLNEEVMRELSTIIRNEIKDPRIHPLRLLEVKGRFAPKKEKEDTIAGLKNAAGYARRCLAQSLNLRNTPELRFILDESIEYGIEMSKKIDALTGGKEEE